MATLYLLGTGAALSDPHRTTTMLALENERGLILVDCGGDVFQRAMACGAALDRLSALVITHAHPDHVSGFPLFMEKLWLSGRADPLPVCGIMPAIDQARRVFETFDTSGWTGLPEIQWQEVLLEDGADVRDDEAFGIRATPGSHGVPVIALRIEDRIGGGSVTFSADTEPSEAVVELARGSSILVHEATGNFTGHSDASQAADVAARAGVDRLLLVHLPPAEHLGPANLARARRRFAPTEIGAEGGAYSF
jgi:ribonuclease Z